MSKGASEGKLGELHQKVAQVMTRALDQYEQAQDHYDRAVGTEAEPDNPPELNSALLSVMVRFLDSNKITCAPEAGNEMCELEQKLAEKRGKRRLKVVGGISHTDDDE